jgi:ABC-type enterochelin transport system permease subunit
MRTQLRHELFRTLSQFLKLLIDVKHANFLRRDMFLKNIFEKFSKRILNKKIVFSISDIEDVICESHLRILNAIDVHVIRHETYFKNLNTLFKKNVEFMLILRLIKIEIFYQLFAFVLKNTFEKVIRSQCKFRKTRRF